MGLTGIDDLVFDFFLSICRFGDFSLSKLLIIFEYMQVLCTFGINMLILFGYMQVWWLFPIKMFDFFEYTQVWGTWGSPNLHILKKSNILMPKMHKACIYSKIIKSFDSEKSPNLHILKKIKKIKNLRLYVGRTGIDDFFFAFFLNICRFGDFSLSKLLIFLCICRCCALLASKCWFFFEYMQVWWTSSLSNLHFCNQKQKRRIDTVNLFFLFSNFPDEKEIHKFKYNEHFSTTWSMIIDTFEREMNIKYCLTAIAKHIVETQTLHWKRLRTSLDM